VRRQIFDDGGYIQHSTNYHRLMMHDLLWALRLGELNGQRLSDQVYEHFGRATEFLAALVDPVTGGAPNLGSNDGALILPINGCDYNDFRPVVQASQFLTNASRRYPDGPWDEDLVWLFGREPATEHEAGEPTKSSVSFPQSGLYILRGRNSWAVVHNPNYKNRPSQMDQLHLDLWWKGINLVQDPGTYLYTAAAPWNNSLAYADVHSSVSVDSCERKGRIGRFLWLNWPHGKTRYVHTNSYEGEHDGYLSAGTIRYRAVTVKNDCWVIVDDIHGTGHHTVLLQWLLPDVGYTFSADSARLVLHTSAGDMQCQVQCSSPAATSLARAGVALEPQTASCSVTRGWTSKYYADKEPALSLAVEAVAETPLRFVTVIMPVTTELRSMSLSRVVLGNENSEDEILLAPLGVTPIFGSATLPAKS
jgi:Heparinase II/III-like protein